MSGRPIAVNDRSCTLARREGGDEVTRASSWPPGGRGIAVSGRSDPGTHSHSMVPGGLPVTSYTTRDTPRTSLAMRLET